MTRRLGRRIAWSALAIVLVLGLAAVIEQQRIRRVLFVQQLFSGADQLASFRTLARIFPVRRVPAPAAPSPLPAGATAALPAQYAWAGAARDTAALLDATDTTGLLVLHEGCVVYERYWRGNDAATPWVSWSVAKSFVSALVGIAIAEGDIASVEEPVTRYAPELRGSAYDGVRIKDVLQMSSGASWNEDYNDSNSDINRFGRTFALGGSLDAFVATLRREHAPGSFNRYNSMDTQVLGLVLRHATGRSLSDYLARKLWGPLGMEHDAQWITDDAGAEFAAGGLNATLRDYARLGELYRNGGLWQGRQLVPAAWVRDSVTPDAPHLQPGHRASSDSEFGYGYQWWVPDGSGAYSAIGIYNQFVYVDPQRAVVIAKTSANHAYGTTPGEASDREAEHLALFRAIAEAVAGR
jgi:CubicO group peptidase (beta-lactamase class C family)